MCNITAPHFQDPEKAREYLESLRWPEAPVCPHCGSVGAYSISGGREGLYKCKSCRAQFTVTVGTVFEKSRVPLNKWLIAVYLMASSKKGISSKQLERTLGVTYKTAWFMTHRIREAMNEESGGLFGTGGGFVEADETFIGKSERNKVPGRTRGMHDKQKVFSLIDRETKRAKSVVIKNLSAGHIKPIIGKHVSKEAILMTDEAPRYKQIGKDYALHRAVNHSNKEYVNRKNPLIHTNTIENYFSVFKRGMRGVYQHCKEVHLHRYLNEFDFRYNYREKNGYNDAMRADAILKGIQGKRLTYNPVAQA